MTEPIPEHPVDALIRARALNGLEPLDEDMIAFMRTICDAPETLCPVCGQTLPHLPERLLPDEEPA